MDLNPFRGIVRKTGPSLAVQEVLYGFIMALIFVTAARIGIFDFGYDRERLVALIVGMNLTWGAIDAIVFYMLGVFEQKRFIRVMSNTDGLDDELRVRILLDSFSGTPLDILDPKSEEEACRRILKLDLENPEEQALDRKDLMHSCIGCFIITALTIIPVVLPIIVIGNLDLALTVASMVSSVILMAVGYALGPMVGVERWKLALILTAISWTITVAATFTGG